jgi:hypothetical protein
LTILTLSASDYVVGELEALVAKLDHFVTDAAGEDLQNRLEKPEQQGADVELLKRLENIITDRGLVEFRSTLAMLLDRLSDTTFEVAVFGRVSSGKARSRLYIRTTGDR